VDAGAVGSESAVTKLRVDMALLNGHDYIAIEEATGKPIGEVLGTAAGMYAAAWRARLRDEPDATYVSTLDFTLGEFDIVNADAEGKVPEHGNGETLVASPESGG
jgi:hypothetical protein